MARAKPKVNERELTKMEARKLGALRKSLGQKIADEAFLKWKAQQADGHTGDRDPTAERIAAALEPMLDELRFTRGTHYVLRRGRGRLIVERVGG